MKIIVSKRNKEVVTDDNYSKIFPYAFTDDLYSVNKTMKPIFNKTLS